MGNEVGELMNRNTNHKESGEAENGTHATAFFDAEHARAICRLQERFIARSEWPTWAVCVSVYGMWIGTLVLLHLQWLSLLLATPLLVFSAAWYMSLQHELLHGHPTRSWQFNKFLGYAPLAVWYPYTLYRDLHIRHHRDADLTVPGLDPETNYVDAARWQGMSRMARQLCKIQRTFIGRMIVGPPLAVARTYADAANALAHGEWHYLRMWCTHGLLLFAMLVGMRHWAGVPVWYYLIAVSWPALSLSMIRSFYEHRAAEVVGERTAINEAGWPMRLLYLNNNYHLVHHDLPGLPWYLLAAAYRLRSIDYIQKNGGFRVAGGYRTLLRKFAFREPDAAVHPIAIRAPRR